MECRCEKAWWWAHGKELQAQVRSLGEELRGVQRALMGVGWNGGCHLLPSTSTQPEQGLTAARFAWCRWFNQLCPTLKREPFSQQEDLLVVQVSRFQTPLPIIFCLDVRLPVQ